MNAILQAQLTTLETAINTLTDSLTAYAPSPAAARDVVAADDALAAGLAQVAQHQRNVTHIRALRAQAAALDDGFTQALTALAGARTTLLDVPLTRPRAPAAGDGDGAGARAVSHTDVLLAARTAVRFTAPLDLPSPGAGAEPAPESAGARRRASDQDVDMTSVDKAQADTPAANEAPAKLNPGLRALGADERAWLDPLDGGGGGGGIAPEELPWPTEAMVARSALARSQGWARAVMDGEERKAGPGETEGGGGKEDAEMVDAGRDQDGEAQRRQQQQRQEARRAQEQEKPRVFTGMELYDPASPDED